MELERPHDSFDDMTEQVPITNVPTRVKLRVEDFLSLDRDGAFDGYGKTELIDGEVTYMIGRTIHRMWSPDSDGYQERALYHFGEPITAVMIANLTIATDHL